MKNQKKKSGGGRGSGWGVRVDVTEELKFFLKIQEKESGGHAGWGGRVGSGKM